MRQSQPLRIECPDFASFGTSRTINSRLWFVNNKALELRLLGYLAKYQESHQVPMFAFTIQGSHYHLLAKFLNSNRAQFYRDFNARTAEAVRSLVPTFEGGPLFERRYSEQTIPTNEDIEEYFFYCALQPVQAGLCERVQDYPGYNSFWDAISGKPKEYKLVNWAAYNEAKRWNKEAKVKDYTSIYTLRFERLPGYEQLPQRKYKVLMLKKLEKRRKRLIKRRQDKGHQFTGREILLRTRPGSLPRSPKKCSRNSRRPLVLTKNSAVRKAIVNWYFSIYSWYKKSVKRYFAGDLTVEFPPGTYRPPMLCSPLPSLQ